MRIPDCRVEGWGVQVGAFFPSSSCFCGETSACHPLLPAAFLPASGGVHNLNGNLEAGCDMQLSVCFSSELSEPGFPILSGT